MAKECSYDRMTADAMRCPKRVDETHCVCWWDGLACCSCDAPAENFQEVSDGFN